jgi:hypothetical protein
MSARYCTGHDRAHVRGGQGYGYVFGKLDAGVLDKRHRELGMLADQVQRSLMGH